MFLVYIYTKQKESVIKIVLVHILPIIRQVNVRFVWISVLNVRIRIYVTNVLMGITLLGLFVRIKRLFCMDRCLICPVLPAILLKLHQLSILVPASDQ